MNFFIILNIMIAVTSIGLGIFVYKNDTRNPRNKTFLAYTTSVFVWSFSYSIWLLQTNGADAFFWSRMLNLGAIFIPVTFLHWVLAFLKKTDEKKYKIILYLSYTISIIFALFSFSDLYVKGVEPISIFPYWPQANWLYFVYIVICYIGMLTLACTLLYKNIKIYKKIEREQIRYAFFGSTIGFIGGAMNFPFMLGIDLFLPVGNILILAFPLLFTYAIINYRLMDIKLALRRSTVFVMTVAFITLVVSIMEKAYEYFLVASGPVRLVMVLALMAIFYKPVKKRLKDMLKPL